MFGLGRKDNDGKQVRIEHRGKYTRASRTGGIALRAEKKLGPVNSTANTSDGIRLSSRVAHGTRVALQNCKFRLLEPIGNVPPAEAEANFYAALETEPVAA